jgi:hypothetical protein
MFPDPVPTAIVLVIQRQTAIVEFSSNQTPQRSIV